MFKNGKYLYALLFSGTLLIIVAMLFAEWNIESGYKNLFNRKDATNVYTGSVADINELLLSGGELTIEEKTSLINLYLKGDGLTEKAAPLAVIKKKRDEVYNEILKRQMSKPKPNSAPSGGFSIRPVPK